MLTLPRPVMSSWFDTAGLASLAKNALKEAQKQIDKALDIKDDDGGQARVKRMESKTEPSTPSSTDVKCAIPQSNSAWGICVYFLCFLFTYVLIIILGSFFDASDDTVTTTPPSASSPKEPSNSDAFRYNDCSSESVDLITSPSTTSVNSPLQSTPTLYGSESIEVLGAVSQAPSENSSILVVASTVTTPGSEFSRSFHSPEQDEESDDPDQNNIEDDEEDENTVSESCAVTVMEPSQGDIITIPPSRQSLHLSLTSTSLSKSETSQDSNESELTVTNSASKLDDAQKPRIMSLENFELQTEFSDSTQSFEEITNDMPKSGSGEGNKLLNASSCGEEVETTTTSSDIEIISNPNGDSSSTHSRVSPNKDGTLIVQKIRGGLSAINRGHSR